MEPFFKDKHYCGSYIGMFESVGRKKTLLIASRPLANDGLTKIEMDVVHTCKDQIDFEIACCFGFDNAYGDELRKQKIICHVLPNKKNPVAYMIAIYNLVKKRKYDVVYIHGNSAMMFLEEIPSKIAGVKVITHCHNTRSDFPAIHYIMKPVFNCFVDTKIGCSSFASKWAYCGKGIITIPNGIESKKFEYNKYMRHIKRTELEWDNKKIVGHIGRFNKQKNHMKLIGIFDEMHKIDKNVRLLLIGDGELRDDIEKEVSIRGLENVVTILDYTNRPQDYMQAMDIMIMPSLFEGLCLVAVEAQANGLPVLIDCFFPPETRATEQAVAVDLSLPDEAWAKEGLNLINKGRKNVADQIKEKKMEQSDMMESIREILTA